MQEKRYFGKRYLYNFLKEHGYAVPKMKEMNYKFFRGDEWLETVVSKKIRLYSTQTIGIIAVHTYDYDEDGNKIETEYSVYSHGDLIY
ncbi:MAG: hypothetical protein NC131_17525 [Roseburia sp.]|nr:hypothetical protein [Roseburia sp.]